MRIQKVQHIQICLYNCIVPAIQFSNVECISNGDCLAHNHPEGCQHHAPQHCKVYLLYFTLVLVYCFVLVKSQMGGLSTLQKQVGCFNHRVVTLVADKLERQWLPEVFFSMGV